jgi:hypothetical protein
VPRYDIVTGVSTGTLIAAFAFLGADHDATLRHIYTRHASADLMPLSLAGGAFGAALFDTSRMAELIEAYVSPTVLAEVARRHTDGGGCSSSPPSSTPRAATSGTWARSPRPGCTICSATC